MTDNINDQQQSFPLNQNLKFYDEHFQPASRKCSQKKEHSFSMCRSYLCFRREIHTTGWYVSIFTVMIDVDLSIARLPTFLLPPPPHDTYVNATLN